MSSSDSDVEILEVISRVPQVEIPSVENPIVEIVLSDDENSSSASEGSGYFHIIRSPSTSEGEARLTSPVSDTRRSSSSSSTTTAESDPSSPNVSKYDYVLPSSSSSTTALSQQSPSGNFSGVRQRRHSGLPICLPPSVAHEDRDRSPRRSLRSPVILRNELAEHMDLFRQLGSRLSRIECYHGVYHLSIWGLPLESPAMEIAEVFSEIPDLVMVGTYYIDSFLPEPRSGVLLIFDSVITRDSILAASEFLSTRNIFVGLM